MRFTDIHCHLLPGLDDGPKNLEETARMLTAAYEGGTRRIVATPHMFHPSFQSSQVDEIRDCYGQTLERLRKVLAEPPFSTSDRLEILLGAENYASAAFVEALEKDRVLTLNGSRFLLVEFPLYTRRTPFSLIMRRIRSRGYTPVLAHAERYQFVQRDPQGLLEFVETGGMVQVNAGSFLGSFWSRARRTALVLLKKGLVTAIASDGHGLHSRPPNLSPAWTYLQKKFSPRETQPLLSDNPDWIVNAVQEGS